MPQIEVTFDIDSNGIVNVSARDKATGKEQQIRIQASGGLSDADIEKMVKDAQAHAEEDKKRRHLVDVKNQADGLIHSAEKNLKEHDDKIPAGDKEAIEKDIQSLKDAISSDDATRIEQQVEALTQSSMKLGEALYKAQQASGNADGGNASTSGDTSGSNDNDVLDATYEEIDESKKKN
jgi:molecular chaperone DnaK